jgi:outer membrane protein OmpA-like peptidoglycan-associated protein
MNTQTRHLLRFALVATIVVAGFAAPPARAQSPDEWSLQKFRPAIHSFGAFSTEAARISHEFTLNAFLMTNIAGPLLQDVDGDNVVDIFGTNNLVVSAAFLDHLSIGLDLPVHMLGSGTFLDGNEMSQVGLGDLRISLKAAAIKPYRTGGGIALAVDVFTPTGGAGGYGREEGLVLMPRIMLDAVTRGVHLMTNIFLLLRTNEFTPAPQAPLAFGRNLSIGSEAGAQVALAIFLGSPDFRMIIEGRFESRLGRFFEPENTQLEATWGLHWKHTNGFAVGAGASFGFLNGYGDPDWRAFLNVGYQPARFIPEAKPLTDADGDGIMDPSDECPSDPEDKDGFQDEDGCPDPDNDRDGIPDPRDRCPNDPENFDGYQDEDGCPDVRGDTDGDGIPDVSDKCPNEAEDKDGFQDEDGCPDADNDADGILDATDKCPNAPEDFDSFEDDDGCAELDNDADGIPDDRDKCPNDAEDKDNFQDDDGCPELDNDADGIVDATDKCPNAPEDMDGCQDEDGCPEDGKVCVTREKIVISDKIFFATNKADILPKSYALIEEIAKVLNENPHIQLIEIQGHTDSQGSRAHNVKLSEARATAVMNRLIMVGRVDPARLLAKGFGPDLPIADNKTAAGRELNRRVEFMILRQTDPQ